MTISLPRCNLLSLQRATEVRKTKRVKKYCSWERKEILLFRETVTIYLLLIMTTNNDMDEETFEEQGEG